MDALPPRPPHQTGISRQLLSVLGASTAPRAAVAQAPPRRAAGQPASELTLSLLAAVECQDVCAVMVILSSRRDELDVNGVDSAGNTALHLCGTHGNVMVALLLLQKGARVDVPNPKGGSAPAGRGSVTPLHCAAWHGRVELMQLLLGQGASPNAVDRDGYTVLHWAAWSGKLAAARVLIDCGVAIDPFDRYGATPLYRLGQATAQSLHGRPRRSRCVPSRRRRQPQPGGHRRQYARRARRLPTGVRGRTAVLKPRAEGRTTRSVRRGYAVGTPLNVAAAGGHEALVATLVGAHADVHARDQAGRTPLDCAPTDAVARALQGAGGNRPVKGFAATAALGPATPPRPAGPAARLRDADAPRSMGRRSISAHAATTTAAAAASADGGALPDVIAPAGAAGADLAAAASPTVKVRTTSVPADPMQLLGPRRPPRELGRGRRRTIQSWTVEDVSEWLASVGLATYAPGFAVNEVDGSSLGLLQPRDVATLIDSDRDHQAFVAALALLRSPTPDSRS